MFLYEYMIGVTTHHIQPQLYSMYVWYVKIHPTVMYNYKEQIIFFFKEVDVECLSLDSSDSKVCKNTVLASGIQGAEEVTRWHKTGKGESQFKNELLH